MKEWFDLLILSYMSGLCCQYVFLNQFVKNEPDIFAVNKKCFNENHWKHWGGEDDTRKTEKE